MCSIGIVKRNGAGTKVVQGDEAGGLNESAGRTAVGPQVHGG